jgi:hypothetical protein
MKWPVRFPSCRAVVHSLCLVVGCLFALLGSARAQLIFADSFNYPDGLIVGAPGSPWTNNYPPTNEASVAAGKLVLTETEQESIRVDFPTAFRSGQLFSRMTVNFSTLPSGDGNYFAFFRASGVDNLRARIWATTNGGCSRRVPIGNYHHLFSPDVDSAGSVSGNQLHFGIAV